MNVTLIGIQTLKWIMVFGPDFLANKYVSYPSIELEYHMKM